MEGYSFIIFRISNENNVPEADTIQELTHKIAIFYAENFIITIQRKKQPLISGMVEMMKAKIISKSIELLNSLLYACLNTYEKPLNKLSEEVDKYEEIIFFKSPECSFAKRIILSEKKHRPAQADASFIEENY